MPPSKRNNVPNIIIKNFIGCYLMDAKRQMPKSDNKYCTLAGLSESKVDLEFNLVDDCDAKKAALLS